ncbi:MAG: hypothetical protein K2X61_02910 [Caulobacteraceae bacterium]|nr:hypothetical protein [Caulobacteraceae bacterium]
MTDINESIAHLTAPDGTKFQVLDETGESWDEAATHAELQAYVDSLPPPPEPEPQPEPTPEPGGE